MNDEEIRERVKEIIEKYEKGEIDRESYKTAINYYYGRSKR